jgi:hypothetical protein
VRADIESQIASLQQQLVDLDAGRRPEPNMLNLTDETQSLALQMEQIVNDVVRYGSMQDAITMGLTNMVEESDSDFRVRSVRMFSEYEALFESRERASYMAFTRMIQDPDDRYRIRNDIDTVARRLLDLDPGLRDVMRNFFKLVSDQINEVSRVEQRSAQRINRFMRFGTADQARGLARQLNNALSAGQALLAKSAADSPLKVDVPVGTAEVDSIERRTFQIADPTPPQASRDAPAPSDLNGFGALAAQGDITELISLVNAAVEVRPVSLAEVVGMLDNPFLGDITVLWSMVLQQNDASEPTTTRRVSIDSLVGGEWAVDLPELYFHKPVPEAEEL